MRDEQHDLKTYFLPGDVVTLRQDLPNKPTMIVEEKLLKQLELWIRRMISSKEYYVDDSPQLVKFKKLCLIQKT